jgi:hypothetical protein
MVVALPWGNTCLDTYEASMWREKAQPESAPRTSHTYESAHMLTPTTPHRPQAAKLKAGHLMVLLAQRQGSLVAAQRRATALGSLLYPSSSIPLAPDVSEHGVGEGHTLGA